LKIRIFGAKLLPSPARKRQALFVKACRFALGRRAVRAEELNLIFLTNPQMRRINKRFLGHDYNTDVIAFPYAVPPAFGDVYVSVDQARLQAKDLGHSELEELLTLAIHGTLHLLGFDDHSPAEKKRMFAKQDSILKRLK